MKQRYTKNLFKLSLAAGLVLSGYLLAASAQAAKISPRGEEDAASAKVTFPVAELGNCNSKEDCKKYCDQSDNIKACVAFAESHGLIKKEEKQRAEKFSDSLKQGETPGGCTGPDSCKAYCESLDHQETCIAFAEKNGFINKEDAQRAKKFIPLMKKGETPGGCTSKDSCEAYCQSPEHQQACVDFGVKIGAITQEQAQKIKQTGGKGPGGCNSQESCQVFCNNESHHDECINFAKEHGLMDGEDEHNIEEAQNRLSVGLKQSPPEVQDCLKQSVGQDVLDKIQDGQFTPSPELGEQMRACFEKFKPELQQHARKEFKAEAEVEDCLKEAVGEDVLNKMREGGAPPDPETGQKMRSCFEKFGKKQEQGQNSGQGQEEESGPQKQKMMAACLEKKLGKEAGEKIRKQEIEQTDELAAAVKQCEKEFSKRRIKLEDGDRQGLQKGQEIIRQNRDCVADKVGEELVKDFEEGDLPSGDDNAKLQKAMRACAKNLHPNESGNRPQTNGGGMSEEAKKCLTEKLGTDNFEQFKDSGDGRTKMAEAVRGCAAGRQEAVPSSGGQQPSGEYQRPPEGSAPLNEGGQYGEPPSGEYSRPPQEQYPTSQYQYGQPTSGENYQQPPPNGSFQQPPPSGEVRGASTSRLPKFIRWILGI